MNPGGMETPLDVLSHAASLVQTDEANREAALRSSSNNNGNAENRSDSPKELPSKINRQRRSTERRELSQALKFDENHVTTCTSPLSKPMTTTTKCAGTQTVLSTVKEYPNSQCLHNMTTLPESAIGEPRTGSAVAPIHNNNNNNHAAITMTSSTQQMMRPSVIACAPPPQVVRENNTNAARSGAELASHAKSNPRQEVTTGMCDPAIDEHFRRSLGEDYKEEYWSSKPSNAISITGTVDDHFAQALGDKWHQMQSPEPKNHETQTASPKPNNHVNLQRSMVSI